MWAKMSALRPSKCFLYTSSAAQLISKWQSLGSACFRSVAGLFVLRWCLQPAKSAWVGEHLHPLAPALSGLSRQPIDTLLVKRPTFVASRVLPLLLL
jgi:hypothetical protein